MRNKTSFWKRSLAALLSLVMVLGMIPAFGFAPLAYAEENADTTEGGTENDEQHTNITGNYITLPITIRDYAADGMLFEYNEVNRNNLADGPDTYTKTDRLSSYTGVAYTAEYNPYYWDLNAEADSNYVGQHADADESGTIDEDDYNYTGLRLYRADNYSVYSDYDATETSGTYWYCVILDASGNVLKVLDVEDAKEDVDTVIKNTENAAYSVWAWRNPKNLYYYNLLAQITEENKDLYRFGFDVTTELDANNGKGKVNLYLGRRFLEDSVYDHGSKGIYVYAGNAIEGWLGSFDAIGSWHCVIINASTGKVVEVIPKEKAKATESASYLTADYKFVIAWSDGTNRDYYDYIATITDDNKSEYAIAIQSCGIGGPALFVERTISVNEADTRGFGLLMTGDYDYLNNLSATAGITSSELISNNPNNNITETNPKGIKVADLWDKDGNQYATQDVYGATIRTNLVDRYLDEKTGKPSYTPDTVKYLAEYMQVLMAIPEKDASGNYNTHHVEGVKLFDETMGYVGPNSPLAIYDLADIFRMTVTGGLGDYSTSKTKFDNRGLLYAHQATTWYDAAYYLLHMLWYDSPVDDRTGTEGQDGYGMPIERYNRIHLVQTTNENGDITYVFNAKYDGTTYDYWNGEIFNSHFGEYNTETRPYSPAYTKGGNRYTVSGTNILPAARFDPLGPSGAGVNQGYTMSPDTYGDFAKNNTMNWAEYYDETNYHLSLEGHAQFVYHYDANQYFTFTGDDDVYLYVNGHRVLDVGGAHSIAKVSIDLNKVAAECDLHDGGTYTFDFFFIERHGTAANFGIETNIQIADAAMNTYKTGYQKGASTGYNGWVDANEKVGYSFELQNDGNGPIYNLTFDDKDIGVYFGYNSVTLNSDSNINEMYMLKWDASGNYTMYLRPGQVTVDVIKSTLAAGLESGERIGIYGFKYKVPEAKWTAGNGTFTNTVNTSATTAPNRTEATLHGTADWKVQRMALPFTPFHVYDWVNKDVSKNPDTVCDWRSPEAAGLPLDDGVTVPQSKLIQYFTDNGVNIPEGATLTTVQCTASGQEDAYNQDTHVTVNADGSITYKSTTTGLHTVFYKIKWEDSNYNDFVFNYDVYTYGSVNNVYVLDYGLSVELAGDTFGYQNNDYWQIDQNTKYPLSKDHTVLGIVDADGNEITTKAGTYGDFAWVAEKDEDGNVIGGSLKYTPDAIIDNTDSVFAKFRMMEADAIKNGDEPTIYNSVVLVQEITTAPASVVYYEENFPGITYVNTEGEDGNQWVHYETLTPVMVQDVDENGELLWQEAYDENDEPILDENGDPVLEPVMVPKIDEETGEVVYEATAGTEQSADQDQQYGYDENYKEDVSEDIMMGEEIWTPGELTGVMDFQLDTSNLSALQQSVGDALNAYYGYDTGYSGTDSNGTVNILEVKETAEVMFFDFVGTGFEIISRTTDEQYAVLNVTVYELDENGEIKQVEKKDASGNTVYQKDENGEYVLDADGEKVPVIINKIAGARAVITESKGGDLYQVPIISLTGLERANYRVAVKAAGSSANKTRVLYIDGVRIYGPLSDGQALEYYNPAEYQADFLAIKELIQTGKMTYLSAGEDSSRTDEEGNFVICFNPSLDGVTPGTGYTVIENYLGDENYNELAHAVNVDAYLKYGPNNELYLNQYASDGASEVCNLIMCYLTPMDNDQYGNPYPDGARTVQIGAHRKIGDTALDSGWVNLIYGKGAEEMFDAEQNNPNAVQIRTGTEMYYPIDVTKLEQVKLGDSDKVSYILVIGANTSEFGGATLALTNLKVAGYTVELASATLLADYESDTLDENPMMVEATRFYLARRALAEENSKEDQTPVNENLTITNAKLSASKVYSGKTATLTVKAGKDAQKIVVTDAQGNEITATRCARKVSGSTVTFTFVWKVTGTKGEVQNFKIRVYDADGLASVNEETVTVTIR